MRIIVAVLMVLVALVGPAVAQQVPPPTPQEVNLGLREGIGQLQEANGRLQQQNVSQERLLLDVLRAMPGCQPSEKKTIAGCVADLQAELAKLKPQPAASPATPGAPPK